MTNNWKYGATFVQILQPTSNSNLDDQLQICGRLASQENNLLVQFTKLGVKVLVHLQHVL